MTFGIQGLGSGNVIKNCYENGTSVSGKAWKDSSTLGRRILVANPEGTPVKKIPITTTKLSSWARAEVETARAYDLVEMSVLGTNFTKQITRYEFCDIVVRMVETMLGKEMPQASATTFADTKAACVLKAYAAGITSGTGGNTFSPNGALTREQMATFVYRALQYANKQGAGKKLTATANLGRYTDRGAISSWAQEAIGFMNAVDIVKGNTTSTIAPKAACTIEQSILVAYRSLIMA